MITIRGPAPGALATRGQTALTCGILPSYHVCLMFSLASLLVPAEIHPVLLGFPFEWDTLGCSFAVLRCFQRHVDNLLIRHRSILKGNKHRLFLGLQSAEMVGGNVPVQYYPYNPTPPNPFQMAWSSGGGKSKETRLSSSLSLQHTSSKMTWNKTSPAPWHSLLDLLAFPTFNKLNDLTNPPLFFVASLLCERASGCSFSSLLPLLLAAAAFSLSRILRGKLANGEEERSGADPPTCSSGIRMRRMESTSQTCFLWPCPWRSRCQSGVCSASSPAVCRWKPWAECLYFQKKSTSV